MKQGSTEPTRVFHLAGNVPVLMAIGCHLGIFLKLAIFNNQYLKKYLPYHENPN